MTFADVRDWSQALLTPLVAVVAIIIAWRQHLTARDRLRLDLYDKRFAVYRGLMEFLSLIVRDATLQVQNVYDFSARTNEAAFLFDESIEQYLVSVRSTAVDLMTSSDRLNSQSLPMGEERTRLSEENVRHLTWLANQLEVAKEKFRPYFAQRKP